MVEENKKIIAVIGLGYVGLPLALEFALKRRVIGFDVNSERISQLKRKSDVTGEVSREALIETENLELTDNEENLSEADIYIVTVPTPIDAANKPDLRPILNATQLIGGHLNSGDIVIYESTVYPGVTEEICAPELERISGLKFKTELNKNTIGDNQFFLLWL